MKSNIINYVIINCAAFGSLVQLISATCEALQRSTPLVGAKPEDRLVAGALLDTAISLHIK
jgi:hypothetical protein